MEFSIKHILIVITSLFFAFTLYWFIQFGTVFWFLSVVGEEVSKSTEKFSQQIVVSNERIKVNNERIKISNERKKAERALAQLKQAQAQEKRVFIASGDHSKNISLKEKRCNEAIFKAMADKSEEALASKKALCDGI
jgi:hypothetical protein